MKLSLIIFPPHRWLIVAGLALAVGCASSRRPEPVPPLPAANFEVRAFLGTPLSGPVATQPSDPDPLNALDVNVAFVAVPQLPADQLEPLNSIATLVVADRGGRPVLTSGALTRAARPPSPSPLLQ